MRRPAVLLFLLLSANAAAQQPTLPDVMPSRSERLVDYRIDARLAEDHRTIDATLEVEWRNATAAPTSELYWHVYNNAWADAQSSFLLEAASHGQTRQPKEWGNTEVSGVRLLPEGERLEWEYLPQPGAPQDRTVARVRLPRPVEPGASVRVRLDFVSLMPRAFRRSGWGSDGYLHAVQWFPKLGVFEELDGQVQWNCPPYRLFTEFYADHGNYAVDLTLPRDCEGKLVATGSILGGGPTLNGDGSITYHTVAEDVHDYAWTVDPEAILLERDFLEPDYRDVAEELLVASALGRAVEDIRPTPVRMILLLQPEHRRLADRYFDAMAQSIYYFGLWYGSYPYPTLSCVDPANDARWTGGMEYPRLITGGARLGVAELVHGDALRGQRAFGHQFWYGLVGNDEFRHAWLDEGFNTFSSQRVETKAFPQEYHTYEVFGDQYYGRAPLKSPVYGKGDFRALLAMQRWDSPDLRSIPALSAELRHPDPLQAFVAELPPWTYYPRVSTDSVLSERRRHDYDWLSALAKPTMDLDDSIGRSVNAYYRPAMTLETMARLMGEERWIRLMRAYHERWRYRHPRPQDFVDVLLEFGQGVAFEGEEGRVAVDWAQFWKQAYHGNDRMDFAVHRLIHEQVSTGEQAPRYDVHVRLSRRTGFRLPVEVRVHWQDGTTSDHVWDGQDGIGHLELRDRAQKATAVEVDPHRRLMLDVDWLNNRLEVEPDRSQAWHHAVQVMLWAQQLLHYYGGAG